MSRKRSGVVPIFLRKKRDFDKVKRCGRRVQTPLFNINFCHNSRPESRVGIVVGKRFGKAVVRNRAKRVFRELVRTIQAELVKGYDVVIFPKRSVLQKKFNVIQENWRVVLQRIGVLRSAPYQSCPG